MEDWREKIRKICKSRRFELVITAIIIVNSALIGLETYVSHPAISLVQDVILVVFTIEIIMRMIAAKSIRDFFRSGWNVFDLFLVLITYVPESLVPNSSAMLIIRLLRVFRVLRLLRASTEIKLIVTVLLRLPAVNVTVAVRAAVVGLAATVTLLPFTVTQLSDDVPVAVPWLVAIVTVKVSPAAATLLLEGDMFR